MAASRGDVSRRDCRADEGEPDVPSREPGMKAVGARLPRYDGVGHVTGRTQYVDDVRVGRTLWVKALRSPHHHAAITKLDTSKAEAMKGVHAIDHARRRAAERLRPSRRARRSRRRAAARRRRGSLQGPADRRGRRRVGGGRAGGGRGDRDRLRASGPRSSTSAWRSIPTRRRSTSGATSIRTTARTTTAACARATSTGRSTRRTRSSRASTARRRSSRCRWRRRSRSRCPRRAAG